MISATKKTTAILLALGLSACSQAADSPKMPDPAADLKYADGETTAEMVVSGGCFWCTEEVCQHVPGVQNVVSGYTGGSKEDATYDKVSTGKTGHAEAIKITYNPTKTTYGQILKVFFAAAHDPTQLNKQGYDTGPHYRSAIFYADEEQKRVAEAYIKQLNDAKVFDKPIVTTLEPLKGFYEAEAEHQDYAKRNPKARYIEATVPQKLDKLKKLRLSEKPPATQPTESKEEPQK
jgi:peptide-methionine (S)-S-oxide reductase